ncbi:hypothetical protein SDC9_132253 [bioreactor metagenome]|uniref:Uncharacterized protein n=1 Tax=bioreactor metagenome TaxID=1076179 RepID=A0A645D7I9_9ZZZZ
MGLPVPVGAGKAADGGDGEGQPGGLQLLARLNLLGNRHALVDFLKQRLVSRLKAEVCKVQSRLAKGGQILGGLPQNALGACICGNAGALGEQRPDIPQNLQQTVRRENQRVSVG